MAKDSSNHQIKTKKIPLQNDYVLSKQVLRSGTGIGAIVQEAAFAESRADFAHKMSMALKEANETSYWLSLLADTNWERIINCVF